MRIRVLPVMCAFAAMAAAQTVHPYSISASSARLAGSTQLNETQGLLGVVSAGAPTLVSDLVNAATGALSQAQVINGLFGLVAADPGGRFVYGLSGFTSLTTLYGYTIDAGDGALTPIPESPYSLPLGGSAVAVEASGRFLYVGAGSSSALGYSIDPATGALTAIAGSPFRVSSGAVALVSDGAGQYLYAAGQTGCRFWRLMRPRGR
jgi:hypothetical protein